MTYLCVDKWRSQWHYRNNGVVVDGQVYTNIRDASNALHVSCSMLHKLIVSMRPLHGFGFVSYTVYNDPSDVSSEEYRHGDKKIVLPGNSSRKRGREHDNESPMRKARVQKYWYQNMGVCNTICWRGGDNFPQVSWMRLRVGLWRPITERLNLNCLSNFCSPPMKSSVPRWELQWSLDSLLPTPPTIYS